MPKNDAITLRANFEGWKTDRADGLKGVEPWLYYCIEQYTKPYLLDDDEIRFGLTEGGNDGGADGIYFIANQRLLVDDTVELDPKNTTKLRVIFIQVKQSGGFKPTQIEKFLPTTDDFFDLSKPATSFGTRYNDKVIKVMERWRRQYIRVSGESPELYIDYYYITGDDAFPDDYAEDAGRRVREKAEYHNRSATCRFYYIGAEQLWEQVQRRPPRARILNWHEAPMGAKEGTVGLVKLSDYYDFVQDDGVFAEYILESNVRGYQHSAGVNRQIADSLRDPPDGINFWLLNNGITIITPQATDAGHRRLSIRDPQIVNGLQTSREIFNARPDAADGRSVLVRVIQTDDAGVQDKVIRATNSQNRMMPSQLRMTDQIHRDLEEIFKKVGLYYDRRKGHYRDQGRPIRKIVSVNKAAQAAISILLQRPNDARARPGDYFKSDERYKTLFGDGRFPLLAYVICVQILDAVQDYLETKGVEQREVKNIKFYLAALVARELTQMAKPPAAKIIAIEGVDDIDAAVLDRAYKGFLRLYNALAKKADRDVVARGTELIKRLDAQSRRRFGKKASASKEKK